MPARCAEPAGAARNAAAIGSENSSRPDASGRAGAAEPPHQMPKAPTLISSATKISAISIDCRRSSPPERHIATSPVAPST